MASLAVKRHELEKTRKTRIEGPEGDLEDQDLPLVEEVEAESVSLHMLVSFS